MQDGGALGLQPGDIIQDTYEITGLLGEGGMGATFRGRNRATGHEVAIKVISAALAKDQRVVQLFKRESNLLRTVRDEGVIRYETTLQDRDNRLYMIMEYVSGRTLADYVRRGARLPSEAVLELGAKLAGGLAAVHKLNIVHRDVSPDNILMPDDDDLGPKLIDFGVASDTIGTEKSIIGDSFAGKINYSAPEQLGLFGNRVTSATDVYALGLVLLRVAGVQVPGEGKGIAAALEARRGDIILEDANLSPALARVLEAMLKADPADRPTDLPALFHRAMSGEEAEGFELDGSEESSGRGRLTMGLAAAAAVVAIAAIGAWFLLSHGPSTCTGSECQVQIAQEILAARDPIAAAEDRLKEGGTDTLSGVYAAMLQLSRDDTQEPLVRQAAAIMAAEMYDPQTYNPERSPFSEPSPTAAIRHYRRAADLGSSVAAAAIARLGG